MVQISLRDESKSIILQSGRLEDANKILEQEVGNLKLKLELIERERREERNLLSEGKQSENSMNSILNDRIGSLERELEDSKIENNKRVLDTPQFRQMKTLMQNQSTKIRDLRLRLQKYEPDNMKEEDD